MADVDSSSWTCVSEGDEVAVFEDVFSVLMTPSPEEVLGNAERFKGQHEVDGVLSGCYNDHRQCTTLGESGLWFRLESAYSPMNREDVYHVIKDVRGMASKELRINDRLVSLNNENTREKSLQEVEFMWMQLEKSPIIQMGIWRWTLNDTGPQIYEIKIVFYNSHSSRSYKELSSLYRSRKSSRSVQNLQWTSSRFKPYRLKIVYKTGIYVSANAEDLNLRGEVITENPQKNKFRFFLRFFECMVQNEDGKINKRFGFVGKCKINDKCFDISSSISESSSPVTLRPHKIFKLSNPDERFFLTYKVEKGDDVFESLLYENMFMKFNIEKETITMQERQARNPLFLFHRFVARVHVSPQVDVNAFSDEGHTFSFVPEHDEDDDSDDDDFEDDSDDDIVKKCF